MGTHPYFLDFHPQMNDLQWMEFWKHPKMEFWKHPIKDHFWQTPKTSKIPFFCWPKMMFFFPGNPWKLSFPQQVHRFARVGAGVDETLQAFEGFVGSDGEIHIWLASERKHNINHSSISIIKNQKSIHQKIIHRKIYPSKHLYWTCFCCWIWAVFFQMIFPFFGDIHATCSYGYIFIQKSVASNWRAVYI